MRAENIETIKKVIEELLEKMTFSGFTVDVQEESNLGEGNLVFNINSRESDLLIGQYGINLQALQHIIRTIIRRKTREKMKFSIDVNNYSRSKIENLEDLARNMARQAINEKRPVVLRPMTAYERRIIHLTLAGNSQVKTESIEEGEERKVVIRPVGNIESE